MEKSPLRERLEQEPDYAPYCLRCETMERMTRDGDTFYCEPKRDTTFDQAAIQLRLTPHTRIGCGNRFNIDTGERVVPVEVDASVERVSAKEERMSRQQRRWRERKGLS